MSFTFAQLKTAIQDYTENNETTFVNNLSVFIRLSEERILKNVQLNLFRKNAIATITQGSQYFACPSDFLAPFSLSFRSTDENKVFVSDRGNGKLYILDASNGELLSELDLAIQSIGSSAILGGVASTINLW